MDVYVLVHVAPGPFPVRMEHRNTPGSGAGAEVGVGVGPCAGAYDAWENAAGRWYARMEAGFLPEEKMAPPPPAAAMWFLRII
jgi:hypothetical protein